MRIVEAFMKGYKPAFLEVPDSKWTIKYLEKLIETYPYITEKDYNLLPPTTSGRYYFFFQTRKLQQNFKRSLFQINEGSYIGEDPRIDYLVGLSLGFPPKAVDYYCRMIKTKINGELETYEQMMDRKIGLSYCGCSFGSDPLDFHINTQWLLERYPFKEAKEDGMFVKIDYETDRIRVPFENKQEMDKLYQHILEKKGMLTTDSV